MNATLSLPTVAAVRASPVAVAPAPDLASLLDVVDAALASVARRLPAHVNRDDLASAGKLALVTTHAYFDGPADELRAYSFVRVRGAMLDELRRLDTLSRQRRAQLTTVAHAQRTLAQRLGRHATLDELTTETQLPVAVVARTLRALAAESAQTEIEWSALPDTESPSPVQSVEIADLHASLRAALTRLPANQALALRLYYLEDATLDDIAAQLRVSRERARQVRDAGEKTLRADFVVLSLWQHLITQN